MLTTADHRLAEGVVPDLEDREVPPNAIFVRRPLVLVWLRHYG